jgi:hypothetical protein
VTARFLNSVDPCEVERDFRDIDWADRRDTQLVLVKNFGWPFCINGSTSRGIAAVLPAAFSESPWKCPRRPFARAEEVTE